MSIFKGILLAKHYPKDLLKLLKKEDMAIEEKSEMVECLNSVKNPVLAEKAIISLMHHKEKSIRESAIYAALYTKTDKIINQLRYLMDNDPDANIRCIAKKILGEF